MRYTEEASIRLVGDRIRAAAFVPVARTILGSLLQRDQELGRINTTSLTRKPAPGVTIHCSSIAPGAIPVITITVDPVEPREIFDVASLWAYMLPTPLIGDTEVEHRLYQLSGIAPGVVGAVARGTLVPPTRKGLLRTAHATGNDSAAAPTQIVGQICYNLAQESEFLQSASLPSLGLGFETEKFNAGTYPTGGTVGDIVLSGCYSYAHFYCLVDRATRGGDLTSVSHQLILFQFRYDGTFVDAVQIGDTRFDSSPASAPNILYFVALRAHPNGCYILTTDTTPSLSYSAFFMNADLTAEWFEPVPFALPATFTVRATRRTSSSSGLHGMSMGQYDGAGPFFVRCVTLSEGAGLPSELVEVELDIDTPAAQVQYTSLVASGDMLVLSAVFVDDFISGGGLRSRIWLFTKDYELLGAIDPEEQLYPKLNWVWGPDGPLFIFVPKLEDAFPNA